MLRFVLFVFSVIIGITVIRSVIGILLKALVSGLQQSSPATSPGGGPPRPPMPVTGELKRDPVCGTYVAAGSSVRRTVRGEELYFCSTECRDKYQPS